MKRIAEPVVTEELCSYGCGQVAKYRNGSGKLMCEKSHNTCPAVKRRNGEGVRSSEIDYATRYDSLSQDTKDRMAWNRGKTSETDGRVKTVGVRRVDDATKLKKIVYKEECSFRLAGCIHNVDGYDLLVEHGMYDRIRNKNGVVRDHIVSVDYGFKNSIDPIIISHPANCRFILHKDNARKSNRCGMAVEELVGLINEWNEKFGVVVER